MGIISIVVVLIVIGLVLWLVETQIPMDATIKMAIRVIIVLAVCFWLLQAFGLIGGDMLRFKQ